MSSIIWNEYIWLPPNMTWADLESRGGMNYPQFRELGYAFLAACIITFIRILTEALVFLPIGYYGGWMDEKKGSIYHRILDHLFFGFAGRSKFKRVAETAWRFTYYAIIWLVGMAVLYNEPQFSSVIECFREWPKHHLPNNVWLYFIVQSGFYLSLLFSLVVFDVRRSDHYEMATHHVATILLLSMSFTINFVRAATLILILHDSADVFLELGKLFRYAGWDRAVTIDFCVFMLVWVGTRLVVFPLKLVRHMLFDAPRLIMESYRWTDLFQKPIIPRVFLAVLFILLLLHIFWTYLLVKIAIKSVKSGVDDIREESESEEEVEREKQKKSRKQD
uniref:TLC domain-containing protein n=1 Tax=Globodera pallida TaxID=36090 RepID=A0A183BNX6_GLOPA